MSQAEKLKQDLGILKEVQVLDREIYEKKRRLVEIPEEIRNLEGEFENQKKVFGQQEANLKALRLKQKGRESELSSKEDELRRLDGQLMKVKTNKEYSAMLQEIGSFKADKSLLEDEIIVLMDQVEEAVKKVHSEKESLQKDEARMQDKKRGLEKEAGEHDARISELQLQRRERIRGVDREIVSLYERILIKRQGVALAEMFGENCSFCHMLLRPQVINEIKLKEQIVQCENCGCILFEE